MFFTLLESGKDAFRNEIHLDKVMNLELSLLVESFDVVQVMVFVEI